MKTLFQSRGICWRLWGNSKRCLTCVTRTQTVLSALNTCYSWALSLVKQNRWEHVCPGPSGIVCFYIHASPVLFLICINYIFCHYRDVRSHYFLELNRQLYHSFKTLKYLYQNPEVYPWHFASEVCWSCSGWVCIMPLLQFVLNLISCNTKQELLFRECFV